MQADMNEFQEVAAALVETNTPWLKQIPRGGILQCFSRLQYKQTRFFVVYSVHRIM